DPKSLEHIIAGTYPLEKDMILEMDAFEKVLNKHNVQVFRPSVLKDCNQIFSRDIAFVIDDILFKANILPDREDEYQA
ncbi:amidinotransferase, partial [Aquimarina celericrescens]|nr:amidinotransferase [Aquimarina celericrescens]